MKILICCFHNTLQKREHYYYKNSHGTFINELADYFTVTLNCGLQTKNSTNKEKEEAGCLLSKKVNVKISPVLYGGFYNNLSSSFRKLIRIADLIRQNDVVHIFVPGFLPLFAIFFGKLVRKKITVYTAARWEEHVENFHKKQNFFKNSILNTLSKTSEYLCREFSDIILFTNQYDLKESKANSDKKFLTHPLASETNRNYPVIDPEVNFQKTNLLFIGEIEKRKNLEFLFKCLCELKIKGHYFTLTIVGDSDNEDYKSYLRSFAINSGIEGDITWLGWVSGSGSLQKIILDHNALILPSKAEGFPKVIYEAQIHGLPVVVSDLPNYRGMLVHGKNALLFNPKKPMSLLNQVITLNSDLELYASLSQGGIKFAETRLNKSAARQYYELLANKSPL